MTTTKAKIQYTGRELRFLSDNYEQAQRLRIQVGERVRAVVQGRDETFIPLGDILEVPAQTEGEDPTFVWVDETGKSRDADATLAAIANGDTIGPVPILGRSYARYYTEERETFRDMGRSLKAHPAWPWMGRVKGIGPTLGCKILARFDATRAEHASSFWAYAGLGTVPGEEYRCSTCGLVRGWPVGYNVTGVHKAGGSGKACPGSLVKVRGEEDGIRVAQPKSSAGEKSTYDRYAKKVLYLAGMSFLKAVDSPYEKFYRRGRAKADAQRPGWADGRRHYLALRRTEKLFLSHLWVVWREALGLPTPDPWVFAHAGHDQASKISPWEMVEAADTE